MWGSKWKLFKLTLLRLIKYFQIIIMLEVCVAEGPLTPQTPDLEVCGSSVARQVVFLDKEPYYTLSLFMWMYK